MRNPELGDFLQSRRARIDLADVGLPATPRRRVPGLRREEVARLAGVSADYYARLEQGRQPTASDEVLEALARALGLDNAERAHLWCLAQPHLRRRRLGGSGVGGGVGPGVLRLMDELTGIPAVLLTQSSDVLAANKAARAVFADFNAMPARYRNVVRWLVLDEVARRLHDDWEGIVEEMIGMLRLGVGLGPGEMRTQRLIEELSVKSALFRRIWTDHGVAASPRDAKKLFHPTAGELNFFVQQLAIPGHAEQNLFTFMPIPGTRTAAAVRELAASFAASAAMSITARSIPTS
jgi:transcriptional regulator with XRE-family HTH domain